MLVQAPSRSCAKLGCDVESAALSLAPLQDCGGERARCERAIEEHIRGHELIPPGGEVLCLVSGGADSTCLWHALGALGYRVSALHVNHGLRGAESEEDARFCREQLGAEVVEAPAPSRDRGRAPRAPLLVRGRPAPRDRPHRLRPGRDRPLPARRRAARAGSSRARGRRRPPAARSGATRPRRTAAPRGSRSAATARTPDTTRGLIRDEILPLLRRLHPAAEREPPPRSPSSARARRALAELLASPAGSKPRRPRRAASRAVREYDRVWLEQAPRRARGRRALGPVDDRVRRSPGLKVRGWRPGDRLAGRRKKIQDVFVDAKVPRSEREAWPLVVRGDEVVAVPGHRRGARREACRHEDARERQTELERAVGEVLIDEERSPRAIAELGARDLGRLRRPRPAADRRPQGRRLLHGRPDAPI